MCADIHLLNNFPETTALGRYAGDVYGALYPHCDLDSFVLMGRYSSASFPGTVSRGIFPHFPAFSNHREYSGIILNNIFFGFIFRRRLKAILHEKCTLHYLNQEIPPIRPPDNDVVTIHDLFALRREYSRGNPLRRQYDRFVAHNIQKYRNFKRIIAVSNHVRRQIEEEGFEGKVTVIHPSYSSSFYPLNDKRSLRTELGLPLDDKLILSVSSNHLRKNLTAVKETMQRLSSNFRLVRIGPPVGSSITFSSLSSAEINKIYNACDALILPSLDEGFGYPVVEAFACGLPVVASDIEVMREVAGEAALLVEPVPEQLAEAVREVVDKGAEFAERGLKRAALYSPAVMRQKIRKYFSLPENQESASVSSE